MFSIVPANGHPEQNGYSVNLQQNKILTEVTSTIKKMKVDSWQSMLQKEILIYNSSLQYLYSDLWERFHIQTIQKCHI